MPTKRESELNADAVFVTCPGHQCAVWIPCGQEYIVFVAWGDWSNIVERDKECLCPVVDAVERAAISEHFNPPDNTAPGLRDADERADLEDMLLD
nr:hypothetical protein [uncultured bacterium]